MSKKGLFLVFLTAIISGISIFINKFGVSINNPYLFTGLKNLLVGIFLFSLLIFLRELQYITTLKKKEWLKLILVGLIGGAVPFMLFFKGLSLTSAAKASFIHKTLFIHVGLLATIFLKEKLNKNVLVGIIALLLGNILFLQIKPQPLGAGDLLILIATLLWAAEITLSKHLLKNLSAKIVAWARMFFGSLFIFAFLLATGQASLVFSLNSAQWLWILLTSAFLFGYVFTFYSGLKRIPASSAASILALGAPITGFLTLIFQGKVFHINQWFGLGLIILGILLVIGFKRYEFQRSH